MKNELSGDWIKKAEEDYEIAVGCIPLDTVVPARHCEEPQRGDAAISEQRLLRSLSVTRTAKAVPHAICGNDGQGDNWMKWDAPSHDFH